MLSFPEIDPVALDLGPIQIHWYGLMYLLGFVAAWLLGNKRAAQANSGWTSEQVSDLIFYSAMGVVLGGRIGFMLFYDLPGFLSNPLSLLTVWKGGMSFHGGFLGVILAVYLFARRYKKSVFQVLDFTAPLVPVGLGAGRMGNFINGELWGRVSDVPWAMVFPTGGPDPRHPSQLYQAGLEGLALFCILWWFSSKPRPTFSVAALFCMLYGVFRFFVEFYRQPDEGIDFVAFGWLTMGQLLSTPMIIVGATAVFLAYNNNTFGKLAGEVAEAVKVNKVEKVTKAEKVAKESKEAKTEKA